MGPIEEHILLHHKDLVEQDSLHLHLLLHLHKGLVEEHIQAQASGSGTRGKKRVLFVGSIAVQQREDFEDFLRLIALCLFFFFYSVP